LVNTLYGGGADHTGYCVASCAGAGDSRVGDAAGDWGPTASERSCGAREGEERRRSEVEDISRIELGRGHFVT